MNPRFDVDLIKDKIGIGADKVYGVMGEFSEPHELVAAGRKSGKWVIPSSMRCRPFRCTASTTPSGCLLRSSAGG